ncbi:MAG TPA: hypothetical protein VF277_06305 [Steroidobacteraceae bacterium]
MPDWYALELGDLLTAQVTLDEIRSAVMSGASPDARPASAVFTRREAGDLHCRVSAYFSPAASDIARRFGAQPCTRPGRRGLELHAGPDSSWDLLSA